MLESIEAQLESADKVKTGQEKAAELEKPTELAAVAIPPVQPVVVKPPPAPEPVTQEADVDDEEYVDDFEDAGYASSGWAMHNAIKRKHMKNPKDNDPSHPNYRGKYKGRGTPGNHAY